MRISGENALSRVSRGLRIKIIPPLIPDKTPGNNDMEKHCSMLVRLCFVDKAGSVHDVPRRIVNGHPELSVWSP